jgi:signal transduction histidine kinase/CheY-like chemotaxis protein
VSAALALARRLRAVGASLDEGQVLAETEVAARELLAADRAVVLLPAPGAGLVPWRAGGSGGAPGRALWAGGTLRVLGAGIAPLDGLVATGAIPRPVDAVVGLAAGLPGEEGPLGVLVVGRTSPRPFGREEEEVLAELAAHAGAALARARSHRAATRRADRLGMLVQLSPRLAEPRPPDALLRLIVEEARRLLGAAAAACHLVEGDALRLATTAGDSPELVGRARLAPGEGLCGQVAAEGRPILIVDTEREEGQVRDAARELAARGVRSGLAVPMVVRDARSAVLSVYATGPHRFGEEDAALLAALAGPAAVALEQARLVRELLDAERLSVLGRIVAGVAHELNNPLAVVIGTVEILRKDAQDGHLAERLRRIGDQAHRAVKIVRSLLALTRREPSQRTPVDLPPLLDEILDLEGYELRSARIGVSRRYERGLPPVLADATQLQQLFTNLVVNAVQAMRDASGHGTLTVTARQDPARDRVVVTVADSGPGIAPADLERVFEAFYTTKPAGQGTGLGLAICRQIVEGHEGRIRAENRPGGGVCFVVELPVYRAAPVPAKPPPRPGPMPAGARVLLVEDERVVGDLLAEFLALAGCEVDRAANGREALEHVRRKAYAVIVSDVRMPDVDGPALYRELGVVAPELARRMVFVTGDVMSPETRRFLDETCLRYLEKPFTLEEFRAVIRGVLEPSAAAGESRASGR